MTSMNTVDAVAPVTPGTGSHHHLTACRRGSTVGDMNNNDATAAAIANFAHVYEGHMRPANALETATTVVSGSTAKTTSPPMRSPPRGAPSANRVASTRPRGRSSFRSPSRKPTPAPPATSPPWPTCAGRTHRDRPLRHELPGPRRAMLAAQREARDILDTATA